MFQFQTVRLQDNIGLASASIVGSFNSKRYDYRAAHPCRALRRILSFNSKRYDYRTRAAVQSGAYDEFQFQTVRLQEYWLALPRTIPLRFNSKRYDYRPVVQKKRVVLKKVSIPNGTITGYSSRHRNQQPNRFQFQTVRLQERPNYWATVQF